EGPGQGRVGRAGAGASPASPSVLYPLRPRAASIINGCRLDQRLRCAPDDGEKTYSLLPPICLSLANTASTLSSSAGFFSSGSGPRPLVVSDAGSSVAPCGSPSPRPS